MSAREPLVVAGCDDGSVRVWDLRSGALVGPPLAGAQRERHRAGGWRSGHEGAVTAVATAVLDGEVAVISAGDDRTVLTRMLGSGAPVGQPMRGYEDPIAVARVDDRLMVLSADDRWDRLCVWEPSTGRTLRILELHDAAITALTVAELGGRPVAVSGDFEGQIVVSDVATGRLVARMDGRHGAHVGAVVATVLEGRALVVSGGYDGTVRRWDLATGAPIGAPLHGHHGPLHAPGRIHALTVTRLGDRVVAISSGWDGELWLWDLLRGERVGEPLDDFYGDVQGLAVVHVDGRQVLACGGIDGQVLRVWDLDRATLERVIHTDVQVLALAPVP